MGIRYYAYAFENDQTADALADPRRFLSADPLADAWGLEPGAMLSHNVTFEQTVPKNDMLYLDKAWPHLQAILGAGRRGARPRPAFRMVEGAVTPTG